MSNTNLQSLANQVGWCKTTKDYLITLNDELRLVSTSYENTLNELTSRGYMSDLLPQLQQMKKEFHESSNDLIGHIEYEHLAYIEKQSEGIRGALEMLTGTNQ